MDAQSLVGAPATEIAAAVRAGQVTARDVVAAHLARIERREPSVGAFVELRVEDALAEAAGVDARGDRADLPLAGVPVAVKDVLPVAGLPTRHGSRALPTTPAETDHVVVRRLREAGAVVVGVTRCPELSVFSNSDDVDGAARNPWDPGRVAGGSSGGSAAAVAAGMVPVAIASDGLGSIRIPAAATGLLGVKPGSGVVPVDVFGRDEHWFGMSQFGPVGTTAADVALVLDVIGDTDRFGATTVPQTPLRIAVSEQVPARGVRLAPAQRAGLRRTADALRAAGHEVVAADPPYDDRAILDIVTRWTIGTLRDAHDLGADLTQLQPRTRAHVAVGRALQRVRDVDAAQAARWQAKVDAFLAPYDLLLTPATAGPPPRGHGWHERGWLANVLQGLRWVPFESPWNLADLPAAAVPAALDRLRLPVAVQLVAPRGRDEVLLQVARQLEAVRPWPRTPAHVPARRG